MSCMLVSLLIFFWMLFFHYSKHLRHRCNIHIQFQKPWGHQGVILWHPKGMVTQTRISSASHPTWPIIRNSFLIFSSPAAEAKESHCYVHSVQGLFLFLFSVCTQSHEWIYQIARESFLLTRINRTAQWKPVFLNMKTWTYTYFFLCIEKIQKEFGNWPWPPPACCVMVPTAQT